MPGRRPVLASRVPGGEYGRLAGVAWPSVSTAPRTSRQDRVLPRARAGREATRDAVRLFCTRLRDDGLIPQTCDITWLADTAGLLSQAQTWLLGRDTLGWTSEHYSRWLATTLSRLTTATAAQT